MPKRSKTSRSWKSRDAPDRRERGQRDLVGAVAGAQAEDDRAVRPGHRVEVIDGLEAAGLDALGLFLDDLGRAAGGIGDTSSPCRRSPSSGQSMPVTLEQ